PRVRPASSKASRCSTPRQWEPGFRIFATIGGSAMMATTMRLGAVEAAPRSAPVVCRVGGVAQAVAITVRAKTMGMMAFDTDQPPAGRRSCSSRPRLPRDAIPGLPKRTIGPCYHAAGASGGRASVARGEDAERAPVHEQLDAGDRVGMV